VNYSRKFFIGLAPGHLVKKQIKFFKCQRHKWKKRNFKVICKPLMATHLDHKSPTLIVCWC
jgi:hypothetical protein